TVLMSGGSMELELLERRLEVRVLAINQLRPCQGVVHVCNELPPAIQFPRVLHNSHRIVFMTILAQENHWHTFLLEKLAQNLCIRGLAGVEVENPTLGSTKDWMELIGDHDAPGSLRTAPSGEV